MVNNLLHMHLKLLHKERFKKKKAEPTVNLIGKKITNKVTRVSKTSPKNNSETNEEQEILRQRCSSPE